jgi:membrane protease YdiL (CAAX protease family)
VTSAIVTSTFERRRMAVGALGLVALVVAVEYSARHVLAQALPTLAAERVNDMLATGVAYLVLSVVCARVYGEAFGPGGLWIAAARRWQAWLGVVAALATLPIGLIDHALWGSLTLPSFSLAPRSSVVARDALWLVPASMLLVNGLLIPLAEEWLWRGLVQPRFVSGLGSIAGIAVTAALFSLKHAIVDASLGRLLVITAGGVVLGLVARAASWRASTISHATMNTLATALALLAQPRCLAPQPPLSPQLQNAIAGAVALVAEPGPGQIQAFFTPEYLTRFPNTRSFLEGVRTDAGRCAYQCAERVEGEYEATALLTCEKRRAVLLIAVQRKPPHRVSSFAIHTNAGP